MRYTAKARMLSFNFLNDDVVYELPTKQGLLLAGMIARSDNLGRLPGEPDVLLSFLFYPRTPRSDMSPEDVRELLVRLVSATPPVAVWYRVKGSRYLEFSNWQRHQPGLREHNRRSSYPGPEASGVEIVTAAPNLTLPLPFEQAQPVERVDMASLITGLARQHSIARTIGAFDPDAICDWCESRSIMDAREFIRFGNWLWNTGTTSMRAIEAVLGEMVRLKPENPYAYFAAGGKARENVVATLNVTRETESHEREKQETKRFLGGAR